MSLKKILPILLTAFLPLFVMAQVTTGGLTGIVKSSSSQRIDGASIKAIHTPTGTVYSTISNKDGVFTISNMKVGGPYKVTVAFVGLKTQDFDDIYIQLGENVTLSPELVDESQNLGNVTVTTTKNALINKKLQGTVVQVGQRELNSLPTITRNFSDFARISPIAQVRTNSSDGSSMGISFAGQSNKYNQFSIDGANSADIFGLSANGTNGGQAGLNPIPMDAIQDFQVSLAPYDVTQGGFTGGGMNAVTKSGTNTMHGSAYGFFQNQDLVGKSADTRTKYGNFSSWTYGARLGGAIIKNKLFYFVNYEGLKRSQPVANQPGSGTSNIKTPLLDTLSNFMIKNYSYNPGGYNNLFNTRKSNTLFARIDWNIDDKNKLMIRNSYVNGSNYSITDGASSMAFGNNAYTFKSITNSTVAELSSNFSSKYSNLLRVTYTSVSDKRILTNPFPSISISDNGATYTLGSDYSSHKNTLTQKVFTLTDNFNVYAGEHTLTFGTNNEFVSVKNVFLQGYYGDYSYTSLQNFYNGVINQYRTTYGAGGPNDLAEAGPKGAQFGLYAQDNWKIKPNFNLTYGLRADMPVYFNHPSANTAFNASALAKQYNVDNTLAPKSKILLSPRIGFNWDVNNNGETQIRGGAGIFTGRVPLVWISNQYSQTGSATIKYTANAAAVIANNIKLDPQNPYRGTPSAPIPSEVDITDRNFTNPRSLRANLALDQKLPWGIIGTIEGVYTKTIKDILYNDINLAPANGKVIQLESTQRPFYNSTRVDPNFSNVVYLTNTSKGHAYNVYARLQKPFSNGWNASLAYSLGHSWGVSDGTSSTAYSNWRFNYNVNGLNNLDEGRNIYDQGSRVVGYVTKSFTYGKGKTYTTTLGLFYTGQSGQTFTYLFYGDINGDDGTNVAPNSKNVLTTFVSGVAQDLMYVPTSAAQFAPLTVGSTTYTPQQQFDLFQQYMNGNSYLSSHKGKNVERNGARMPWENHFDFKFAQDFLLANSNKITITAEIFNVGNLLSKNWGKSYYMSNQSVSPLTVTSSSSKPVAGWAQNGNVYTPTYTFNPQFGNNQYTGKPWTYSDYGSRWSMQLGLRYTF